METTGSHKHRIEKQFIFHKCIDLLTSSILNKKNSSIIIIIIIIIINIA